MASDEQFLPCASCRKDDGKTEMCISILLVPFISVPFPYFLLINTLLENKDSLDLTSDS